jgi:anti-sigma B factor antagonist
VSGVVISTVWSAAQPDEAPFEVALVGSPEPGAVVARVTGELDAAADPLLQQSLPRALPRADRLLMLDLSGVTFSGSAGVTALVWLSQHPEAAGRHVRAVATSRIVTGPLELTGLLVHLDVSGMPTSDRGPDSGPAAARPPADPHAMHGRSASATMGAAETPPPEGVTP